jgi:hypothetical protein
MVGVVGSNPIVSTKFPNTQFIRDAEECRELAPQRDCLSAEARAFCVDSVWMKRVQEKAASAAFLFSRTAKS